MATLVKRETTSKEITIVEGLGGHECGKVCGVSYTVSGITN